MKTKTSKTHKHIIHRHIPWKKETQKMNFRNIKQKQWLFKIKMKR